jgi:hypothetical protein
MYFDRFGEEIKVGEIIYDRGELKVITSFDSNKISDVEWVFYKGRNGHSSRQETGGNTKGKFFPVTKINTFEKLNLVLSNIDDIKYLKGLSSKENVTINWEDYEFELENIVDVLIGCCEFDPNIDTEEKKEYLDLLTKKHKIIMEIKRFIQQTSEQVSEITGKRIGGTYNYCECY